MLLATAMLRIFLLQAHTYTSLTKSGTLGTMIGDFSTPNIPHLTFRAHSPSPQFAHLQAGGESGIEVGWDFNRPAHAITCAQDDDVGDGLGNVPHCTGKPSTPHYSKPPDRFIADFLLKIYLSVYSIYPLSIYLSICLSTYTSYIYLPTYLSIYLSFFLF